MFEMETSTPGKPLTRVCQYTMCVRRVQQADISDAEDVGGNDTSAAAVDTGGTDSAADLLAFIEADAAKVELLDPQDVRMLPWHVGAAYNGGVVQGIVNGAYPKGEGSPGSLQLLCCVSCLLRLDVGELNIISQFPSIFVNSTKHHDYHLYDGSKQYNYHPYDDTKWKNYIHKMVQSSVNTAHMTAPRSTTTTHVMVQSGISTTHVI